MRDARVWDNSKKKYPLVVELNESIDLTVVELLLGGDYISVLGRAGELDVNPLQGGRYVIHVEEAVPTPSIETTLKYHFIVYSSENDGCVVCVITADRM